MSKVWSVSRKDLQSSNRRLALGLMILIPSATKRISFIPTLLACGVAVGFFGPVSRATAEIANELEPDYAEAVLEYNSQKYDTAIRLLTEIQKKAPKTVEVLELKAITYKAMKNEKGAADAYRDLIQVKTKEGKDKAEIAPYSFELGVIRYNEKNWKQAEDRKSVV